MSAVSAHQLAPGGVFGVDVRQLLFAVDIGLVDGIDAPAAGVAAAVAAVTGRTAGVETAADDLLPLGAGGVLDQQGEHGLTSYPAMESIFSRKMP